ncbi:carbohydrate-binding protein [Compostibacter hankyongensis]|uniref:CBM6 domain-containing protein n=1 Tax=Compostibacter hankyongensis TaxID=1007089 RepID=A0ABP8FUQ4_9BACT
MVTQSISKKLLLLAGICLLALQACQKDNEFRNAKPVQEVGLNSYDFLSQQQGLYDTLLYLLRKTGLDEQVKKEAVTFFVPQDFSIFAAMDNLNYNRKQRGQQPNWTLDSIPAAVWDTLLSRYLVKGIINSDSVDLADGVTLNTLAGHAMNARTVHVNASGIEDGGPILIQYNDMNDSRFIRDWVPATTQTADLKTQNGEIHVLDTKHIFGFNSFIRLALPQIPYKGEPRAIPGVIELADYDLGGEGLAYHDNDVSNNGNQYRGESVDLEVSSEGDYDVGWTAPGEWISYTVNVAETGDYLAVVRIASPNGGRNFHLEVDGVDVTGSMEVPNTGNYQSYTNVSRVIHLTKGKHILKFFEDTGAYNATKMTFTKLAEPLPAPYSGTPAAIPGTFEAADYDKGGEGIAYHDDNPANTGPGVYRTDEGVDIENASEGGHDIGWTVAGEWLIYTVNVAETGTYKVETRVASPGDAGRFHIEFDGVNQTGTLIVPNTGGYQNWTGVTATVELTAGRHVMRFFLENSGYNLHNFIFTKQ